MHNHAGPDGIKLYITVAPQQIFFVLHHAGFEASLPKRAGIVGHPSGYQWSSHAAHSRGTADRLVGEHALYRGLGRNDAERQGAYRDLFRRHYPEVRLRDEKMLCLSAETDGVVTAGGVVSWHDLSV